MACREGAAQEEPWASRRRSKGAEWMEAGRHRIERAGGSADAQLPSCWSISAHTRGGRDGRRPGFGDDDRAHRAWWIRAGRTAARRGRRARRKPCPVAGAEARDGCCAHRACWISASSNGRTPRRLRLRAVEAARRIRGRVRRGFAPPLGPVVAMDKEEVFMQWVLLSAWPSPYCQIYS